MEQVNHPQHYNTREDGLECIDIIRHYTCDVANAMKYLWRDGLKQDADKTAREKEIEDLRKAIWYINDELYLGTDLDQFAGMIRDDPDELRERLLRITGKTVYDIIAPYPEYIANAMRCLLHVGLIDDGFVYRVRDAVNYLRDAIESIEKRILELQSNDKEI